MEETATDQNADMIVTLMENDQAFMYKLTLVKDKIITNLGEYADSLVPIQGDLIFTDDELDEIEKSKSAIKDALGKVKKKSPLLLPAPKSMNNDGDADFDTPNKKKRGFTARIKDKVDKADKKSDDNADKKRGFFEGLRDKADKKESEPKESIFEKDATRVVIEKLGPDAEKQFSSIFKSFNLGKLFSFKLPKFKKFSLTNLLKTIGTSLLGSLGLTSIPAILSRLAAAGPVAAIAGGIIWMAIDGIRGFFKAKEWGVSKTSGVMGGLLGGMDKGLKGALKNMGKWALIGAGIGSFVPVVGTILGGLIGAAIGAILGWIGGERIAKAFDAVGAWFKEQWNKIVGGFKGGIWNGVKTIAVMIWDGYKAYIGFLVKIVKWVWDKLTGIFGNMFGFLSPFIWNININRNAVPLHLPVGWYRNIIPVADRIIRFIKIFRAVGRIFYPIKFPGTIQ